MKLKFRLLIGVAAPFMCGLAAPAFGQEISTGLTNPVSTATIANGQPADISITTAGSVTLTSQPGATAVTINSNNKVTNAGAINVSDSDNAVGLRIGANLTTGYTATGAITVLEAYDRPDNDKDGDLDGPVAIGTGRVGILLEAGGTMTGDIRLNTGGAVTVEGNNSAAVSLRSILDGTYFQLGALNITGANSIALDVQKNVTGDMKLLGAISASGEGAKAVQVLGDVGGEFTIESSVLSTGFTSTLLSNFDETSTTATADKRDPDDLLIGGPALTIRGNLARGFLNNGPATGGVDPTENVKDVIQNYNPNRGTGTIASVGSSPAVLIAPEDGAAGRNIVLSKVRESVRDTSDDDADSNTDEIISVWNYDVGFLNRGTISANGFNIGFAATAVQIGGSADGTHTTVIEGGFQNTAAIVANSYEANATGVRFDAGMSTPTLINNGSIAAITNSKSATSTATAMGVIVGAGANLGSVVNTGLISASVQGYDGDAVAFRDLSGTVASLTNSSRIVAGHTDNDTTDSITTGKGRSYAIDLSKRTGDTVITQQDTIGNARIFGDVLFGSGNDRFDILSGEVQGDVDFGAGAGVFNLANAKMYGDVKFGGANATVSLNKASFTGDLDIGNATSTLSLVNDSNYSGALLTGASSNLAVTVDKSVLYHAGANTARLSSLSLANGSELRFAVNDERIDNGLPIYSVAGAATIGAGTVIRPVFTEFTNRTFNLRLLQAGTLNLTGDPSSLLATNLPYLYNMSLSKNAAGDALDIAMRVKTASELGVKTSEAPAYAAVLQLLESDSTIGAQLTAISDATTFQSSFANLLPVSDTAMLKTLAANANAAFGATARRLDLVTDRPLGAGGAWLEEFGVYHAQDATADAQQTSGAGFGVAGGLDLISSRNRVLGAFFSFENLKFEDDIRDKSPLNSSQYSYGLYGGLKRGNFAVNAAASYGLVNYRSRRDLTIGTVTDLLQSEWSGSSITAAGRVSYNLPLGWLSVRPFVSADYVRLTQDGHTETSANKTSLAVTAGDAETSLATASYGAVFGAELGGDPTFSIRPEINVGWRQVLDYSGDTAISHFGSLTTPFQLGGGPDPEDALVAGIGLHINSEFVNLKLGYDTEITDTTETHYGSLTLRLTFW